MEELRKYKYNGARTLVLLHDKHLRSCVQTWREAKRLNINLPVTEDEYYKSLETLLFHFLRSARNYMVWICDKLGLPDPQIENPPEPDSIEEKADEYLFYLLDKWKTPLAEIEEEKFHSPVYTSRWGVDYCIDAMLEHAVMHPVRHEFQLKNLIQSEKMI
ncbi:MAG TPA: hypothetical protein VKD08_02700 [Ignavibacteriaceae bacterium]|jgi:hypothetical protein|nr:hypothetical protein [Ignavibacteriaceae bacterium]